MPDTLQSFASFPRLPRELQAKIWECCLEAPQVTPRVVKVHYERTTSSFSYTFTIPPPLQACRLSREIARKFYLSLIPSTTYPVYLYPQVDFLYCKVPLEPSDLDPRLVSPGQPILPFLNPEANVSLIRFLVLDNDYWAYRLLRNHTCPIKELRNFQNITKMFLALPPLQQWLERRKQAISWLSLPPGDPRADIDRLYAIRLSQHTSAQDAIVPGFRLYAGGDRSKIRHKGEIAACFGRRDAEPDPFNPNQDHRSYAFTFDEYWGQRELPSITEVIAAGV